jgi:hypothetical protein
LNWTDEIDVLSERKKLDPNRTGQRPESGNAVVVFHPHCVERNDWTEVISRKSDIEPLN